MMFIHTKTTGFDVDDSTIFELQLLWKKKLRIFKIKPYKDISVSALSFNGVTEDEIMGYDDVEDVFWEIEEYLSEFNNKLLLCGWASQFHTKFLRRLFLEKSKNYYNDYFYPESVDLQSIYSVALASRRNHLPNFRFDTICGLMGIDDDIQVCKSKKLFKAIQIII